MGLARPCGRVTQHAMPCLAANGHKKEKGEKGGVPLPVRVVDEATHDSIAIGRTCRVCWMPLAAGRGKVFFSPCKGFSVSVVVSRAGSGTRVGGIWGQPVMRLVGARGQQRHTRRARRAVAPQWSPAGSAWRSPVRAPRAPADGGPAVGVGAVWAPPATGACVPWLARLARLATRTPWKKACPACHACHAWQRTGAKSDRMGAAAVC